MENNLKKYREQNKLTLKALGKLSGTTASQISKLEKGIVKLTDEWCLRIAPHLNVQPGALLPTIHLEIDNSKIGITSSDIKLSTRTSPMPSEILQFIITTTLQNKADNWDEQDIASMISKVYFDLYGDDDLTVELVKGYMKRMFAE